MLQQDIDELHGSVHEVVVFATEEVPQYRQQHLARVQIERSLELSPHYRPCEIAEHSVISWHVEDIVQLHEVTTGPQLLQPAHLVEPALQNASHLRVLCSQLGDLVEGRFVRGPLRPLHTSSDAAAPAAMAVARRRHCPLGRPRDSRHCLSDFVHVSRLRHQLAEAAPWGHWPQQCRRAHSGRASSGRASDGRAFTHCTIGNNRSWIACVLLRQQPCCSECRRFARDQWRAPRRSAVAPTRDLPPLEVGYPDAELCTVARDGEELLLGEAQPHVLEAPPVDVHAIEWHGEVVDTQDSQRVAGSAQDSLLLHVELDCLHRGRTELSASNGTEALEAPELHRPVRGASGQEVLLGVEGDRGDGPLVCVQVSHELAGRQIPELHLAVLPTSGNPTAMRAKPDGRDATSVTLVGLDARLPPQVPDL
mmetsp:Transcript_83867/g.195100  ORF Transcript_83867/g.195100 Transcript_83867/m.195100 type:complete len:422 (-) Transcript_83867:311-1576(-)